MESMSSCVAKCAQLFFITNADWQIESDPMKKIRIGTPLSGLSALFAALVQTTLLFTSHSNR